MLIAVKISAIWGWEDDNTMTLRLWLILCLCVTTLHLSVLQSVSLRLDRHPGVRNLAFVTRSIAMASPPETPPTRQLTAKPKRQAVMETPATFNTKTTNSRSGGRVTPIQASAVTASTSKPLLHHQMVASPAPAISAADSPVPSERTATHKVVLTDKDLPGSVKLNYKVTSNKFPYMLHGELVWQRNESGYLARLSFGALGQTRTQTSRGRMGHDGLMPDRFSDKYRSEVAAHFNHETGWVTFSANTPDAKLQAGAQDRLSVLVQLATLVSGSPQQFKPGNTLTVQTIGPRAADLWLFTFGKAEQIQLPGGHMEALHLVRNPDKPYDQQIEIWLAQTLSYMPARIRITETNGDYIDQQWVASEAVR